MTTNHFSASVQLKVESKAIPVTGRGSLRGS
jgi:hypothetical protein